MSKFLSIIEELMPGSNQNKLSADDEIIKDIERKKKNKEQLSPQEIEIDKMKTSLINKAKDNLKKQLATASYNPLKEEEEDSVAQEPQPEAEPDAMSPEGEVFYVDLIKKALFVDLDNVDLTATEKDVVTTDVTPQNAKEVADNLS